MRVVLYTGKGGVGKTTTAAATAAFAAQRGLRTLVASADAAHSLGDVLEERLGPSPRRVAERLDALEVDARAEMERQWGSIRDYLVRVFRYQGIEEGVADELALMPGAEELTTLLAIEQHVRSADYDLVIVDCAPTGSALRLLTLPDVARSALRVLLRLQRIMARMMTPVARSLVAIPLPPSQVFRDAEELLYTRLRVLRELLTGEHTSVRLVVTPERMVIDEALRARLDLALFELPCDAVVMNRVLPDEAAVGFFRDWALQARLRTQEVEESFAPLPVLTAPLQPDEVLGVGALAAHGASIFGERDPAAVLSAGAGLVLRRQGDTLEISLSLPNASADALEVAMVDGQLVIRTPTRRRLVPLPRYAARLALRSARLEQGTLRVELAPEAA